MAQGSQLFDHRIRHRRRNGEWPVGLGVDPAGTDGRRRGRPEVDQAHHELGRDRHDLRPAGQADREPRRVVRAEDDRRGHVMGHPLAGRRGVRADRVEPRHAVAQHQPEAVDGHRRSEQVAVCRRYRHEHPVVVGRDDVRRVRHFRAAVVPVAPRQLRCLGDEVQVVGPPRS